MYNANTDQHLQLNIHTRIFNNRDRQYRREKNDVFTNKILLNYLYFTLLNKEKYKILYTTFNKNVIEHFN